MVPTLPSPAAALLAETPCPASDVDAARVARWAEERTELLEMLAQQQRIAQTGLIAGGLAHDVMNIVTGIRGSADLGLASSRPEDHRRALERVDKMAQDLAETTRSLLSFVKRSGAQRETAPFRLAECVESALRLTKALARERGVVVRVEVEGDPVACGDARLAVQALVNLISNSVRAFPGHAGTVTVRAWALPLGSALEVSDDGPGIPEALRPRLFRPFATGRAASGGTGLGLFIVRQVVRRLRGTIRLRTGPTGTTIRLAFPPPSSDAALEAAVPVPPVTPPVPSPRPAVALLATAPISSPSPATGAPR